MSPSTWRAALVAAMAVALGLVATVAALAVLAGSLDGPSPASSTGTGCPAAASTSVPGNDTVAAPLQRSAATQGDDHETQLAAETVPAHMDGEAIENCDPAGADTIGGSDSTVPGQRSGG